ncbi:MAG TPA: hypothetical protein VFB07_08585 [Vicinamibacterales bacterium]|nr:hypothetical protein [Vicinamibacterales bacterium]
MNLKYFHLFFIGVSVVLAAFVAAWGVNNGSVLASCLSVVSAAALIVYGTLFQRKMRRL